MPHISAKVLMGNPDVRWIQKPSCVAGCRNTEGTMDDAIMYWNAVALEANRISHTNGKMEQNGPPLSSRP